MTPGLPTAGGWHPDPSGAHQLRFFDGTWTEHVSDAGVASVSPLAPLAIGGPANAPTFTAGWQPPVPYGPPPAPRKSVSKMGWMLIGGGGLVVLVVIVLFVAGVFSAVGSGPLSVKDFCSELNNTYDTEIGPVLLAPKERVTTEQVNQAISDANKLASEAPDSIIKGAMTDSVKDLNALLKSLKTNDTAIGIGGEEMGIVIGWQVLHCPTTS